MNNIGASAIPNKILRSAATRNTPTPSATDIISTRFGMDDTCSASTCRSGSEIVIITPRVNPTITIIHNFFVLSRLPPTLSPIGVIESSAPIVKNIIPPMTRIPPRRNCASMPVGIGAIVNASNSTMSIIGSTDQTASCAFSFVFSLKLCFIQIPPFLSPGFV